MYKRQDCDITLRTFLVCCMLTLTVWQVCRGADSGLLHHGGAAVAVPRPAVRAGMGRPLHSKVSFPNRSTLCWVVGPVRSGLNIVPVEGTQLICSFSHLCPGGVSSDHSLLSFSCLSLILFPSFCSPHFAPAIQITHAPLLFHLSPICLHKPQG